MQHDDAVVTPSFHLFPQPTDPAALAHRSRAWSGDEFSFRDVLDAINPLQHIPLVSTVYRYLTGDEIGAVPRIIGDSLFGGPIGFIAGLVGASLKQESGKDIGEHMLAMVSGPEAPADGSGGSTNQGVVTASAAKPGVPTAATITEGSGPIAAAAVGASSAVVPNSAQPAAPLTIAPVAVTGGSPFAARPGAAGSSDAGAAFLARGDAVRRLPGAQTAHPLNNRPVPLQTSVPLPRPLPTVAPQPAPGAPSVGEATPGDLPPGNLTPGNLTPAGALPGNPPIDISQQMMDALDKYARLQQQRGAQVDVAH
jgi:hypothetical protein